MPIHFSKKKQTLWKRQNKIRLKNKRNELQFTRKDMGFVFIENNLELEQKKGKEKNTFGFWKQLNSKLWKELATNWTQSMTSFISAYKNNENCHYTEPHTTKKRKNRGKKQKVISITRGNGVYDYKIKMYSKVLNIFNYTLFQRHLCHMQLVSNVITGQGSSRDYKNWSLSKKVTKTQSINAKNFFVSILRRK